MDHTYNMAWIDLKIEIDFTFERLNWDSHDIPCNEHCIYYFITYNKNELLGYNLVCNFGYPCNEHWI